MTPIYDITPSLEFKGAFCYFQSIIGVLLEWTALVLWDGVSLTLILIITKIIDIFSDFAL